ncbi:MAG: hypothetical protein IKZ19_06605 [Clostridia bacterium]|nr:hypothetical protein [Clostridia bacterium]
MTELLRCDFKRILKDKLFLVLCILAGVFALITPLLYALIFGSADLLTPEDMELMEMMGLGMSSKTIFFSSFSLNNNFGLILPILLTLILCKDFGHGTVRNKLISGHSRRSVFLSMFTVCCTFNFGIILVHALLSLGVSLIFFPYSPEGFGGSEIGYFFASIGIELLVFLFISALVCLMCVLAKNAGLSVVLYAAVMFFFILVASILQVGQITLSLTGDNEFLIKLIEHVQKLNVFGYASLVGQGTEYTLKDALFYTLTPVFGTLGLGALGLLVFGKKDIK